jgi:hypothetical protein
VNCEKTRNRDEKVIVRVFARDNKETKKEKKIKRIKGTFCVKQRGGKGESK